MLCGWQELNAVYIDIYLPSLSPVYEYGVETSETKNLNFFILCLEIQRPLLYNKE